MNRNKKAGYMVDKIILASLAGVMGGLWAGAFFQFLNRSVGWMLSGNFSYKENKENYRKLLYFLFMILVFASFLFNVSSTLKPGMIDSLKRLPEKIPDIVSSYPVETISFVTVLVVMTILTYKYAKFPK